MKTILTNLCLLATVFASCTPLVPRPQGVPVASRTVAGIDAASDDSPPALPALGPPALPPEPVIPPPGLTLTAEKSSLGQTLDRKEEEPLDTGRLQQALDSCPPGQSVRLLTNGTRNAFVSGPLAIRRGITLWIDEGVTLFASRDPRQYDRSASSCGVVSDNSKGCKPLFLVKDVTGAGIVGKGRIDGRGGEPLLDDRRTWWDIAQEAKRTNSKQSVPRLIEVERSRAFTLYQITLNNSPNFHVVLGADGFVVWGVTVQTPSFAKNSLGKPLSARYARNTDGIDPSGASNGFIVHSRISVGDDHIAIKANKGPTTDLVIAHNHFGIGHGMSIGSETVAGVRNIRVHDLSIDGDVRNGESDEYEKDHSGLRIKSSADRGGLVTGVIYTDVCMRDVPVPIHITSAYAQNSEGGKLPSYRGVVFHNVRSVQGRFKVEPQVKLMGLDAGHRLSARFDNVVIDGALPSRTEAAFARIAFGPGPVNLEPAGQGVDVKPEVASAAAPFSCENRFIPFEVR